MERRSFDQLFTKLQKLDEFAGLGWGLKEVNGRLTASVGWRVYLRKKLPLAHVDSAMLIPAIWLGCKTDVIECSPTSQAAGSGVFADAGGLIVNDRGIPGTLGCFAFSSDHQARVLLTNQHVLFGSGVSESSPIWRFKIEGELKNKTLIGNSIRGKIGTVEYRGEEYHVDCAIGNLTDAEKKYRPDVLRVTGSTTSVLGSRVSKKGQASGYSEGIVVDNFYTERASINGISYRMLNQIVIRPTPPKKDASSIQPFAMAGDSGAVILNDVRQVTGLLWGVNAKGEGLAAHIGPVLQELNIVIPKSPNRLVHFFIHCLEKIHRLFKRYDA